MRSISQTHIPTHTHSHTHTHTTTTTNIPPPIYPQTHLVPRNNTQGLHVQRAALAEAALDDAVHLHQRGGGAGVLLGVGGGGVM
jgi:hypothetical protein